MPSMTPDLRIAGLVRCGLRSISGMRFSVAGRISRGRGGSAAAACRCGLAPGLDLGFLWTGAAPRSGHQIEPFLFLRRSTWGVACGIGCSDRGRASAAPANRYRGSATRPWARRWAQPRAASPAAAADAATAALRRSVRPSAVRARRGGIPCRWRHRASPWAWIWRAANPADRAPVRWRWRESGQGLRRPGFRRARAALGSAVRRIRAESRPAPASRGDAGGPLRSIRLRRHAPSLPLSASAIRRNCRISAVRSGSGRSRPRPCPK